MTATLLQVGVVARCQGSLRPNRRGPANRIAVAVAVQLHVLWRMR
jgi:hypothetical protein